MLQLFKKRVKQIGLRGTSYFSTIDLMNVNREHDAIRHACFTCKIVNFLVEQRHSSEGF